MDDFERESNASSDEQEDELMQDAEENEDHDQQDDQEHDEEDNENEDEEEDDHDNEEEDENHDTSRPTIKRTSATPAPFSTPGWQLHVRPEALNAPTYDIVPTMAAPMSTSINAISVTPDLRYWITGGSDGYIRKYDGPATINGKQLLTVAQRHPFVDSVVKAGVLMSYWENAEPQQPSVRADDVALSPVYSLAVHSQALWLFSGLESGGINLQSVRHDEGKRITSLQGHTNAVSVLTLAPDETSMLSGSWDKNVFDWDLNTGQTKRSFDGSKGQISAIETRPMGGMPVPPEAGEEDFISDTFFSSDQKAANGDFDFSVEGITGNANGDINGALPDGLDTGDAAAANGTGHAQGSPANDSLFGGSPGGDDDLFGDNFTGDDDNEFSRAMMQDSAQDPTQNGQPQGENTAPNFDMSVPSFDASMNSEVNHTSVDGVSADISMNGTLTSGGDSMIDGNLTDSMATTLTTTQPTMDSSQPTAETTQQDPLTQSPSAVFSSAPKLESPPAVFAAPPATNYDPSQTSESTFLSASMDGTLRIWDRRVPNPIARIGTRAGVPPWCMGSCWSYDGNWIYVGRRNGTVEEFSVAKARGGHTGWQPERVFKFPNGSGPVSCVRPMPNGRHLVCASQDILRLYDLRAAEERSSNIKNKHSPPPFLVVPGPPRAGVISCLYVDPSARFMISAAGTRGWEGSCTEVLIGYEIGVPGMKTS